MNRHLEIALIAAILTLLCGHQLWQRLRRGLRAHRRAHIIEDDAPPAFWLVPLLLGVATAAFILMAFAHLVLWIDAP